MGVRTLQAKAILTHTPTLAPDVTPAFHVRSPSRRLSARIAISVNDSDCWAHKSLAKVMIDSSRATRLVALNRRCNPSVSANCPMCQSRNAAKVPIRSSACNRGAERD